MDSLDAAFGQVALQAVALLREERDEEASQLLEQYDEVQLSCFAGALIGIAALLSKMAGMSAEDLWREAEHMKETAFAEEVRNILDES